MGKRKRRGDGFELRLAWVIGRPGLSKSAETLNEAAISSLDIGSYGHKRASFGVDLRVQKQSVDVRASAEYLPFRSKVFECSLSSHVIEHVQNPQEMIIEMRRVTYGKITLEFPTPEYSNILKWTVHEYLAQLPFSIIDFRHVVFLLLQLYKINAKKPSTYHRWIIYPERLGAVTVKEDPAKFLQPLSFLTQGRKARYFQSLKTKRKTIGLLVTLYQKHPEPIKSLQSSRPSQ